MRALPVIAISLIGAAAPPGHAAETMLEPMPAKLETAFALSALPPALRDEAAVYLLDPTAGYHLARPGTSGIACLVERTAWELADFRDDIYFPLCYDSAGTATYLQTIMDAARLRAEGMAPAALKAEIEARYASGRYTAPDKPGLSYMVGPVMRTLGPPDLQVHTMAMPHLMFYAPHVTNADIGAKPDLGRPASLLHPFIDRQGNGEQSYMIQLIGATEKAQILVDEQALIDDLCAYRDILCLPHGEH